MLDPRRLLLCHFTTQHRLMARILSHVLVRSGGLMKVARGVKAAALALVTAGVITLVGVQVVTPRAHAQNNTDTEQSQIAIGSGGV